MHARYGLLKWLVHSSRIQKRQGARLNLPVCVLLSLVPTPVTFPVRHFKVGSLRVESSCMTSTDLPRELGRRWQFIRRAQVTSRPFSALSTRPITAFADGIHFC